MNIVGHLADPYTTQSLVLVQADTVPGVGLSVAGKFSFCFSLGNQMTSCFSCQRGLLSLGPGTELYKYSQQEEENVAEIQNIGKKLLDLCRVD